MAGGPNNMQSAKAKGNRGRKAGKGGGGRGASQKKKQKRQGQPLPGGGQAKKKDKAAKGNVKRTKMRPGGWPGRSSPEERAHAHTYETQAWRPLTQNRRCRLPGRNDDGSVFRRLCVKYSISSERPPHVFPVVDLDLPLCLVRASVLFVTTDGGHGMADSDAILERGGLEIIFSGGGRVQHRIVLGIRCAARSSTVLEWLAKIIALWILARAGFKGSVCLLCDNAAVQTCYFDRWIRTATWFDRLAKWVFCQPVMPSVIELWLPAQHDSGDTGVAASWQRQADAATTRGLEDPDRYPIPWGGLLGVLEDPLSPVCYQGSVVFKLNAFTDKLYDSTLGQQSALGRWVQEHGFDMSTSGRVCHDTGVTFSQHRQANHPRTMQFLARVFFDVPDCRYCGLYHGNEQTHVGACVELYDRQCRTVVAVAEFMSREFDYNVLASWDTVLQLCKSEVAVGIAVEVDALFAVRKAALCRLPGQQVVVITVSGLLWVSHLRGPQAICLLWCVSNCLNWCCSECTRGYIALSLTHVVLCLT